MRRGMFMMVMDSRCNYDNHGVTYFDDKKTRLQRKKGRARGVPTQEKDSMIEEPEKFKVKRGTITLFR